MTTLLYHCTTISFCVCVWSYKNYWFHNEQETVLPQISYWRFRKTFRTIWTLLTEVMCCSLLDLCVHFHNYCTQQSRIHERMWTIGDTRNNVDSHLCTKGCGQSRIHERMWTVTDTRKNVDNHGYTNCCEQLLMIEMMWTVADSYGYKNECGQSRIYEMMWTVTYT